MWNKWRPLKNSRPRCTAVAAARQGGGGFGRTTRYLRGMEPAVWNQNSPQSPPHETSRTAISRLTGCSSARRLARLWQVRSRRGPVGDRRPKLSTDRQRPLLGLLLEPPLALLHASGFDPGSHRSRTFRSDNPRVSSFVPCHEPDSRQKRGRVGGILGRLTVARGHAVAGDCGCLWHC